MQAIVQENELQFKAKYDIFLNTNNRFDPRCVNELFDICFAIVSLQQYLLSHNGEHFDKGCIINLCASFPTW